MVAAPILRWSPGLVAGAALLAVGGFGPRSAMAAGQPEQSEQAEPQATAAMMNSNGGEVGRVVVRGFAQGMLFVVELDHLPDGVHAIHVHETGTCEPPDFESAGKHYAPLDNEHGFANQRGFHGGDLPNVHANVNGWVRAEFFVPHLALTEKRQGSGSGRDASAFAPDAPGPFPLLDDDGSAIVVHENADDYGTQPAGNSGGRIACGVIESTGGGQGGQGGQGGS